MLEPLADGGRTIVGDAVEIKAGQGYEESSREQSVHDRRTDVIILRA